MPLTGIEPVVAVNEFECTRPAESVLDKRSSRELGTQRRGRRFQASKGDQPADRRDQQANLVVDVFFDCLPGGGQLGRSRLTATKPLVRQPGLQLVFCRLLTQREQRRQQFTQVRKRVDAQVLTGAR